MYIQADAAMRKRRMLESPSCAVELLQQPNLGELGAAIPATVQVPSFSMSSPAFLAGAALLGLMAFTFFMNTARGVRKYQRKRTARRVKREAIRSQIRSLRAQL